MRRVPSCSFGLTSFHGECAPRYAGLQGVSNGIQAWEGANSGTGSIEPVDAPEAAEAARSLLVVDLRQELHVDLEVVLLDLARDAPDELGLPAMQLPRQREVLRDEVPGAHVVLRAVVEAPILGEVQG